MNILKMNPLDGAIYKQGKDGRVFIFNQGWMFDPVTLAVVGTGMMAGGQVYSGLSANAEGKSSQNMANYNAQLAEREAKMTEQKTAYQQKLQAEEADRRMSTLRAGLGASGAVTTEGAPLMIQSKQASEFEMENLMTGFQGAQEAQGLRSEANLQRMQGKQARRAGKNAMIGSFIGAGSSLMTGFGSMGTPVNSDKALAAKHGIAYNP
jgi:hypothetical protein